MAPPLLNASGFALITAILWGLSPVIGKKGLERGGTSIQAAMTIIVTTSVLAWVALLLTHGTASFNGLTLAEAGIFLFGGIVGTTLGRLAYYAGVRRVGASVSVGVMNTRPVFSIVMAIGFLNETVTPIVGVGVLFLTSGVLILSLSKGGDIRGWSIHELAFPIAAAIAFGAGNVIRRFGFVVTPASILEGVTLNETAAIFTLGLYLLVFRHDQIKEANVEAIRYFVLAGVISGLGLISFFQAISIGRVSIVDPLSSMAPLFGTVFAYLLLRDVERVTSGVMVGALLIVIGGVLIT